MKKSVQMFRYWQDVHTDIAHQKSLPFKESSRADVRASIGCNIAQSTTLWSRMHLLQYFAIYYNSFCLCRIKHGLLKGTLNKITQFVLSITRIIPMVIAQYNFT
jgi:hypothetical protein